MRIRVAKIPRRCCNSPSARCPYYNKDNDIMYDWCEHPKVVRKHGDTVDLKEHDKKTGYHLRLPDCPIKGRILTEEGR